MRCLLVTYYHVLECLFICHLFSSAQLYIISVFYKFPVKIRFKIFWFCWAFFWPSWSYLSLFCCENWKKKKKKDFFALILDYWKKFWCVCTAVWKEFFWGVDFLTGFQLNRSNFPNFNLLFEWNSICMCSVSKEEVERKNRRVSLTKAIEVAFLFLLFFYSIYFFLCE